MVDPKSSIGDKVSALPKIALFYAWWYPTRWIKGLFTPSYLKFGRGLVTSPIHRQQPSWLARASTG